MSTRVLHIFVPNFKRRFGGPIFDWKFAFSNWNDPSIEHFVLDYDDHQPKPALEAFSFEISESQTTSSRKERALWIISLLWNLIKYRKAYDLLHFHVLWWGGLLAATWANKQRIPTLYQSVLLNSDTPSPILKQKQGRLKERLLRNFSLILSISDALAQDYYDHGYSKDQVITLMNSVDTNLFHPLVSQEENRNLRGKYDLPLDASILLFTGSIIQRKGVDILIKSFCDAYQHFPDLYLLLIGPKSRQENPSLDETYVKELQKRIEEGGFCNQVKFTGLIKDRNMIADLYQAADMFVFPSRNEGLPNVVLEAMACGLPVIVSDLPGLKPVIKHGENGWVIPIDNENSLTEAIYHLKENPALISQLGSGARRYIQENHQFQHWQTNLVAIYQKLSAE